jgi:hypothetical protein
MQSVPHGPLVFLAQDFGQIGIPEWHRGVVFARGRTAELAIDFGQIGFYQKYVGLFYR